MSEQKASHQLREAAMSIARMNCSGDCGFGTSKMARVTKTRDIQIKREREMKMWKQMKKVQVERTKCTY